MKITNTVKNIGILLVTLFFLAGCGGTATKKEAKGPDAADQAIAAAKAAVKKAAKVGGVWRDTGKFIKKAKKAAKAGNKKKAIKLANKAKRQAELGYAQAVDEKRRYKEKMAKGISLY